MTSLDRLGHLADGELAHADLAWDLEQGSLRPSIWAYQVVPFHGGTFVSSLLFVPWSALFGREYASLKGLALGYALAAMVLWMWTLHRIGGTRAAVTFGWLYALAPPVLVRMQLTLWSTHPELNAFLALGLALAVATVTSRGKGRRRRAFLFGVAAGFAVFFNLSAVIFVGLLIPVVLSRLRTGAAEGAPSSRMSVVAGFGLGIAPMALAAWAGAGSVAVYGQGPSQLLAGALGRLSHLPRLLVSVPPWSPQVPPGQPESLDPLRVAIGLVLLGCCVALVVGGRRVERSVRPMIRVIGLYPLLFLVAFAAVHLPFTTSTATTFGYCPRYAATLYPGLHAALAIALALAVGRGHRFGVERTASPGCLARVGLSRGRRPALAGRMWDVTAAGLLMATVLGLTVPALVDDLSFIDPETPDMARRFEGVRLFRSGLRGVDRRSLSAALTFLELEARGEVPPETAAGVRAVLGPPWYTDFWRFLRKPPDGPTAREVFLRVRAAQDPARGRAFAAGLAWGARMALGRGQGAWDVLSIQPPDP